MVLPILKALPTSIRLGSEFLATPAAGWQLS